VEVEAQVGQLGKLQPLEVPVVVEMARVRRTTTIPGPQAPPVRVLLVATVRTVINTPQVEVVVPEVLVVLEAVYLPVMVESDAPRRLLEHVSSMPVVVAVATMATIKADPFITSVLGLPVTVVKAAEETAHSQLAIAP
jgi:hypothetical protein